MKPIEQRMDELVAATRDVEKAIYDAKFDEVVVPPSIRNAVLDLVDEVYRVAAVIRRRSE